MHNYATLLRNGENSDSKLHYKFSREMCVLNEVLIDKSSDRTVMHIIQLM